MPWTSLYIAGGTICSRIGRDLNDKDLSVKLMSVSAIVECWFVRQEKKKGGTTLS
jgi:hypothetical protein